MSSGWSTSAHRWYTYVTVSCEDGTHTSLVLVKMVHTPHVLVNLYDTCTAGGANVSWFMMTNHVMYRLPIPQHTITQTCTIGNTLCTIVIQLCEKG